MWDFCLKRQEGINLWWTFSQIAANIELKNVDFPISLQFPVASLCESAFFFCITT